MYFDDKYFKTEEIDGFVVDSMMKRAWAAEMEIMQEIDRICKENDLQYYAAWGTLLGTIRHKGFIPWDDDIDIWMKRKDYNRFIEIIKKELDSTFCICHYSTLEQWDQYFLGITNGREINTNEEHLKRFHGFPFVAGVDVFPLDYISDDEEEMEIQKELIKIIYQIIKVSGKGRVCDEPEENQKVIKQIEELCNIHLNWEGCVANELLKVCDTLYSLYNENDSHTLTEYYYFYENPQIQFPEEYFVQITEMDFEIMKMPVMKNYDEVLTILFGDYMTPVWGTQEHDYPFYKKQQELLEAYLKTNESDH